MVDLSSEWNISFAGCGFRSIYYVGALSCILERVPQLLHGASKFGGASSGCLVAAALAVGIPIGESSINRVIIYSIEMDFLKIKIIQLWCIRRFHAMPSFRSKVKTF